MARLAQPRRPRHVRNAARTTPSATGPGAATTNFLVDRNLALPEVAVMRDGSGKVLRDAIYGLGRISVVDAAGGIAYQHTDALGSVTDRTSSSGNSLAWSEYAPYGAVRSAGSLPGVAADPFGFSGQYRDATTGLYHLRARQYDPGSGRFLSTDPVASAIGDPFVASYVYGRDNPAVATDPSGLCWPLCFAAVGAVVGGAIGGLAYSATHATTFNGQEALGAVAGGAVAGAATAVAGPLGGSIAAGLGFAAGGGVATGAAIGIGAAGGAAGAEVTSLVSTGRLASPGEVAGGAILNGIGGYAASSIYRTVGIYTARQAALFGPHSWWALITGMFGTKTNATATLRQSIVSSLIGSGGYLVPTWGSGK